MANLMSDIRLAVRSLWKSKLFAGVAIVSLALGIGANTAVFSLVNAVAFRPLPYTDPDRLVDLHEWSATKLCAGCGVGTSTDTYHDWRRDARSFAGMGAYNERPFNVSGTEAAERFGGALVSADVFRILGIQPALGRAFVESDDRADAPPVVLLSDALWQKRYASDRRIVGQTIRVNGVDHTVIGVMPPNVAFPEFAELWVPLEPNARHSARDQRDFGVVARLAPGVSVERADAEMQRLARGIEEQHPEQKEWTARATSLRSEVAGTEASLYGVMLGAVAFVLLIVCANLAGLLLARGAARRKEIAIRLALGATRGQIVRHLLVESVLLACAGGALGLLVALWTVDLAVSNIGTRVPFWIKFGIDGQALAFCVVISVVTGVLFGILPALRASRPDVHTTLKDAATGVIGNADRSHLRALLVVGELAIAIVLLAGAGVLFKNFLRISEPEHGYDRTNLLTSNLEFLDERYREPAQLNDAYDRLIDRVSRIPGASSATLDRTEFVAGFGGSDRQIRVEGLALVPTDASPRFYHAVTPDYRRTMRLPLVAGRDLNARDRAGSAPVTLINRRMGELLWPGASPIGHRIKLGAADSLPWVTIVGVVGDIQFNRRAFAPNYAYVPMAQSPGSRVSLYVRAPREPLALAPAVRTEVRAVDPDLPVLNLRTLEQEQHAQYWPYEMYALFMSGFACLAILLAVIGLYGVIAYNAAQRTREIGIRIALGAESRHVVALIGAQGGRLVVLGVIVGIIGSALLLRVLESLLIGASPIDPPIFAAVALLLASVALVATYLPARRAARVDPLVALRTD